MLTRRLVVAALPAALALPARAQAWPSRPVRIVIAYPPGGSTDLLGRALAQRLQETMAGSTFLVDNRPGGGAIPGTEAVARPPPMATRWRSATTRRTRATRVSRSPPCPTT